MKENGIALRRQRDSFRTFWQAGDLRALPSNALVVDSPFWKSFAQRLGHSDGTSQRAV
ncbi:hypothetical protein [Acidovorax sp. SUPP3334]|uniref:hypothetical protein n=1 Tax=Acidovorax sp. SUPP3334 TaxID=2920881 RepID=UPI0023DE485E|nr:hypothetical protein [Acidovorax sp. SUPP3334]GKT25365.1 hypothetical protein AVHM3334_17710 [Acidovorax sp. SUPP3334]